VTAHRNGIRWTPAEDLELAQNVAIAPAGSAGWRAVGVQHGRTGCAVETRWRMLVSLASAPRDWNALLAVRRKELRARAARLMEAANNV